VQELRGEKIDIVPWTTDPAEYVCRALAPAKVSKIIMDEDERAMEVIVPDDQLSLAIGKKGQNVRLASRLTGWSLDVRSESEAEDEARRARAPLIAIPGIRARSREHVYPRGCKPAAERAPAHRGRTRWAAARSDAPSAGAGGLPPRRSGLLGEVRPASRTGAVTSPDARARRPGTAGRRVAGCIAVAEVVACRSAST